MHLRYTYIALSLATLTCFVSATSAAANSTSTSPCDSLSPEFERLGDEYFDIEPLDALTSNRDRRKIEQVLTELSKARLSGGKGERLTCFPTDIDGSDNDQITRTLATSSNSDRVRRSVFELRDLILLKRSNGEHILKAYEDDSERRLIKAHSIDLPGSEYWSVDPSNPSQFMAKEKYRKRNVQIGTANLIEVDLRLIPTGSSMELQRTLYINGHWAESLTWKVDA
ncbi:MAG: hypothetical protein KTR35_01855 [Gammaproteobacteria bacterium]|nr:hypothetical protein [Gammaproteobacteria bacterium]